MVSSCWTCFCRPMGFVVMLLLFLGPLVAQGKVRFRTSSQPDKLLWQTQQSEVHHQALRALRLAHDFLNRKYNATYYRAPGRKTHIMTEMAFGRAYHVNIVLVNASCPKGYMDVNPTDCKVAPDAPRLECHLVVILLFGSEHPCINEESCQEIQRPLSKPNSSSSDSAEEEEPKAETEAVPSYV